MAGVPSGWTERVPDTCHNRKDLMTPGEPTDTESARAYLQGFDDCADIVDMPALLGPIEHAPADIVIHDRGSAGGLSARRLQG
jgi:hypothetical protein